MKTMNYFLSFFVFAVLMATTANAQNNPGEDSTGLPGDNFDLQGALQRFQNAASPEDFEKAINTEGNHVNNLDLDGDDDIDYIRVVGKMENDVHVFVLQVAVSATENQDVAVIELEKTGKETAVIQIIGDEDIYGEQVIIEPDGGGNDGSFYNDNNNSNLSGPNVNFNDNVPCFVINVWLWPSVRFVYTPFYKPWYSPWRWNYYPGWWKPWRPFGWSVWHPFRSNYHRSFVVVRTHRVVNAHRIYTPFRSSSIVVKNRHSASVNNFRVTRSRTSVSGPRGKTTTVKKTTVTGPRGNKATKVKVRRH